MGTDDQMHPKSKMWTLDCEDYVKNFKNDNSIFEQRRRRKRRRQFRHLMPIIPSISSSSTSSSFMAGPTPPPPPPPHLPISPSFCTSTISNTYTASAERFSWKDHLMMMSKVEKNITSEEAAELVVSSRWNPTPEQLKALQEMYQRGVRTPSAEEIQLIAAKLRHFGRIEGKNVFYWFQNHKARERQKRRRHQSDFSFLEENINGTLQHQEDAKQTHTSLVWKDKGMDADHQNKKLVTLSNCILIPKGSASMHETAVTESRSNGWTYLDDKQQRQQQTCHRRTAAAAAEKEHKIFWADQENRDDDDEEDNNSSSRENKVLQLFPVIIRGNYNTTPFKTTTTTTTTTNNNNKIKIKRKMTDDDEEEEEVSSGSALCAKKITPNKFYEFL